MFINYTKIIKNIYLNLKCFYFVFNKYNRRMINKTALFILLFNNIRIKEKKTHRMGSKAAEAQIGLTAGFEAVGPVMSQSSCIYWSDRHYL